MTAIVTIVWIVEKEIDGYVKIKVYRCYSKALREAKRNCGYLYKKRLIHGA